MTITKQHRFRHMFRSFEGDGGGGGLEFVVQVNADLHYADSQFVGLSLYHTSSGNSRSLGQPVTQATTRTGIGTRDDMEIQRRRYDVTTIYSVNPIGAAQAAIWHHLWAWTGEAGGKDLLENEWHRMSYNDQVVTPLEAIITALCFDRDGLDEISAQGEIYFIPQWQIDFGFGPGTQKSHDWFTKGRYISDVFTSADEQTIYMMRQQIDRSR